MADSRIALLVAPFWGQRNHVGTNRVERFVRWLSEAGWRVVLLRAGTQDAVRDEAWGKEVTVRDPLGLYAASERRAEPDAPQRKPNRLRRALAYRLLVPDPSVVWAGRAGRSALAVKEGKGARLVLSSSPPESAHLAALALSKKLGVPHWVDLRDGWLDEPLRPELQNSFFRKMQEGREERRVLKRARHVFVTSQVWQEMLQSRLPFAKGKVTVLTNAYPVDSAEGKRAVESSGKGLYLLHTGRLRGSSSVRRAGALLEPLLWGLPPKGTRGRIVFLGELLDKDSTEIGELREMYEAKGWTIEERPPIARDELLKELPRASGLLLLSASQAAIPSKLFEYIPARRPILSLAPRESATWRVCEKLPQAHLLDLDSPKQAPAVVGKFLERCVQGKVAAAVPEEYSEAALRQVFLEAVKNR